MHDQRVPAKRVLAARTVLVAVLGLLLFLLLAGCGERLKTTISVYHSLPDSLPRTNFAFVQLKEQASSNENVVYRERIRDALLKHRLVETDIDQATLLVSFSYSVDNGRERTTDGFFKTETFTEYRRGLWVYIFEKDPSSNGQAAMLYEGGALSAGESTQLGTAMPAMIKALFRDFPGRSGTRRIEYIKP